MQLCKVRSRIRVRTRVSVGAGVTDRVVRRRGAVTNTSSVMCKPGVTHKKAHAAYFHCAFSTGSCCGCRVIVRVGIRQGWPDSQRPFCGNVG